jgi:hypothetical protein
MILIALLIGAVLLVAAIRNSQDALFAALGQDVPEFVIWAAAIFAVGALGFIPGIKPVARGLVALVLIVIVLSNYSAILAGFDALAASNTSTAGGQPNTQGSLSGSPLASGSAGGASSSAVSPPQAAALAPGLPPDPAAYGLPTTWGQAIGDLTAGFGGGHP